MVRIFFHVVLLATRSEKEEERVQKKCNDGNGVREFQFHARTIYILIFICRAILSGFLVSVYCIVLNSKYIVYICEWKTVKINISYLNTFNVGVIHYCCAHGCICVIFFYFSIFCFNESNLWRICKCPIHPLNKITSRYRLRCQLNNKHEKKLTKETGIIKKFYIFPCEVEPDDNDARAKMRQHSYKKKSTCIPRYTMLYLQAYFITRKALQR